MVLLEFKKIFDFSSNSTCDVTKFCMYIPKTDKTLPIEPFLCVQNPTLIMIAIFAVFCFMGFAMIILKYAPSNFNLYLKTSFIARLLRLGEQNPELRMDTFFFASFARKWIYFFVYACFACLMVTIIFVHSLLPQTTDTMSSRTTRFVLDIFEMTLTSWVAGGMFFGGLADVPYLFNPQKFFPAKLVYFLFYMFPFVTLAIFSLMCISFALLWTLAFVIDWNYFLTFSYAATVLFPLLLSFLFQFLNFFKFFASFAFETIMNLRNKQNGGNDANNSEKLRFYEIFKAFVGPLVGFVVLIAGTFAFSIFHEEICILQGQLFSGLIGPDNIFLLCIVIFMMGHSFYTRFFALSARPPKDIVIAHSKLFKKYVLRIKEDDNNPNNNNSKKQSENYGELDEDNSDNELEIHQNENDSLSMPVPEDIVVDQPKMEEKLISVIIPSNNEKNGDKKMVEEMEKGRIQDSTASLRLTKSIDPMFLEQPEL